MSELAFNLNGEPFELPPTATAWRVRKFKPKGAPEVVYGREGTPLVLPIDSDIADLRRESRAEGRYRLDAVDDNNRLIAGAPPAYVCVHPAEGPSPALPTPEEPEVPKLRSVLPLGPDAALIEAMRVNSELARAVVDKIPAMLESAAILIRAADGAGMPARPLRPFEVVEVDGEVGEAEEESEVPAPPPLPAQGGWAFVGRVVEAVAPDVMRAVLSGKLPVPGGLGAMLDAVRPKPGEAIDPSTINARQVEPAPGRRVPVPAPSSRPRPPVPGMSTPTTSNASSAPAESPTPAPAAPATIAPALDGLPTLDATDMTHFGEILGALTHREQMYAQALSAELSPAQLRAWIAELKQLSVADGVSRIRAVLGVAEDAATKTKPNGSIPGLPSGDAP